MKKRILIFGGNSFLANAFSERYEAIYDIQRVYRNDVSQALNFDFEKGEPETIAALLTLEYDALLFFQGINPAVGAREMTAAYFENMLRINLVVPSLLVSRLSARLKKGALVLFVSSVAKKKGSYDPAYGSAKAGLTGLMHSLANAYPALRFNLVSPGLIEDSPAFRGMTPDFRAKHADRMKNKQFIKAADVADAVAALVADPSVNRSDIEIDGGYQ